MAPDTQTTEYDTEDFKPWDTVPYAVLVKISGYLVNQDRCRMACVCRQWNTAALDPSLWRRIEFRFYSECISPGGVAWLRPRVHHIRHTTIHDLGCYKGIHDRFLLLLQRAQFYNLEIIGTGAWTDFSTDVRMKERLLRVITRQKHLTGFKMQNTAMEFGTGMSVLEALSQSSRESITRLELEDFCELRAPQMHMFSNCIMMFPNLRQLKINYEFIEDRILYWFAHCAKERVIDITIVSWLNRYFNSQTSNGAWAAVKSSCPGIRVHLCIQNFGFTREVMDYVLQKEMPIKSLHIVGIPIYDFSEIQDFMQMLGRIVEFYSNTLSSLKLCCDFDLCREIEECILQTLLRLGNLRSLELQLEAKVGFLRKLLGHLTRKEIKLDKVRIFRLLSEPVQFSRFRRLVTSCYPNLVALGLDFYIKGESSPSHSARRRYACIVADPLGIQDNYEDDPS